MSTAADTRVMELTTTVRLDRTAYPDVDEAAEALEVALIEQLNDEAIPTIKQYFVRARGNGIEVGLRFDGMRPEHVRGAADDVLSGALTRMSRMTVPSLAKRTSTTLVGA